MHKIDKKDKKVYNNIEKLTNRRIIENNIREYILKCYFKYNNSLLTKVLTIWDEAGRKKMLNETAKTKKIMNNVMAALNTYGIEYDTNIL